jgi:hemerythrin-like domain-containing protein
MRAARRTDRTRKRVTAVGVQNPCLRGRSSSLHHVREADTVCEYCGCRQVEPLADLMDEHLRLLEIAGDLRRALEAGDRAAAAERRVELVDLLTVHTRREEAGIFAALRSQGDYVDEVDALESEHVTLDQAVAALDLDAPDAVGMLERVVADLSDHIDKENLGIFPVAVVTLGATGWEVVERAHELSNTPTRSPG